MKKCLWIVVVFLVAYLSLYTWNWKTHYLDRLATDTGLEAVGWVLLPGDLLRDKGTQLWNRYMYLVGVRKENERLRSRLDKARNELHTLRARAREAKRLQRLMDFRPPPAWEMQGARIVGQRLGSTGALQTIIVDKGEKHGVHRDQPVVCPAGVVGRVYKVAPHFSQVLLLTDPNSRLPVISKDKRIQAIAGGRGPGKALSVDYVSRTAPLKKGKTLLTSGLAGVFPKGFPVGRVTDIRISEVSLFQVVQCKPVVDVSGLEEVFILSGGNSGENREISTSGR